MQINNSERLTFRLMNNNDAQTLWEIDQDPAVMRYLANGQPTSLEKINTVFMPRMEKYRNPKLGWGIWQVSDKKTDKYLGWVLVRPMAFFTETPNLKNIELGWRFFKHAWGYGYATEAATAIKEAIIINANQLNSPITEFSALAVADNIASINVMKRIGMQFIRAYTHQDPIGNFDAVHYQMSAAN